MPVDPEKVVHLALEREADPEITLLLDVDEQSADRLHRRPRTDADGGSRST